MDSQTLFYVMGTFHLPMFIAIGKSVLNLHYQRCGHRHSGLLGLAAGLSPAAIAISLSEKLF